MRQKSSDFATTAVHGPLADRQTHPDHTVTTPIRQTATYTFPNTAALIDFMEAKTYRGERPRNEYARYGNPSVQAVEDRLAALESDGDPAVIALLYPSGMTAVTNLLLGLLVAGTHVVYTDDCYSKTRQFIETFLPRFGIESTEVPVGDYAALEAAITPQTRLIVSESPTNPYLRVADLAQLSAIARCHPRVRTMIDATFATPVNQRPLTHGIDFVVHSATKYLGGHNDLLAGVLIGRRELLQPLRQQRGMLGGIPNAHTAYLLERGLKTLHLRVGQQNRAAQQVAEFLEGQPLVERVWYPGLPSHPDHAVATQQMDGYGGVVSFEIKPVPGEPLGAKRFPADRRAANPADRAQPGRRGEFGDAAVSRILFRPHPGAKIDNGDEG
jgi:cystathionine gamma-synthase